MPRKVLIVKEGEWGSLRQSAGDYDDFVDSLKKILEGVEQPALGPRGEDRGRERVCEVEVFSSTKEAVERTRSLPMNDGPATLVFVSRGMLGVARKVKSEYPRLKVVLFTGLFPEDEVIIASKAISNSKVLEDVVLRW